MFESFESNSGASEIEIKTLPEGFDRAPGMIALRNKLVDESRNPLERVKEFEKHLAFLRNSLDTEVLESCASYYILQGEDEKIFSEQVTRFDLEGEYSVCDFLQTLH